MKETSNDMSIKIGLFIGFIYSLFGALLGFIIYYNESEEDIRKTLKEFVRLISIEVLNDLTNVLKKKHYRINH